MRAFGTITAATCYLFKLEFHGTDTGTGTDTDIMDAPVV